MHGLLGSEQAVQSCDTCQAEIGKTSSLRVSSDSNGFRVEGLEITFMSLLTVPEDPAPSKFWWRRDRCRPCCSNPVELVSGLTASP